MIDSGIGDYRIEKFRYPVVLTMIGGERLSGDMFVQSIVPFRDGPEEPPDVLNGAERFFPLATAEGDTLLVAKDQVAEAEAVIVETDDDAALRAGLRAVVVELTLANGMVRSGAMLIAQPTDRPRLLDYLNRLSDRFIALRTTDGVRFINRLQITRVRPLD